MPPDVKLKSVDLTVSLESLSFFLAQGDESVKRRRKQPDGMTDRDCRTSTTTSAAVRDGRRVGDKAVTAREAVARGRITMSSDALRLIRAGALKKGDPLQTARLAGIMAAKRTADLIPLCHPLPLSHVDVDADAGPRRLRHRGAGADDGADRRRDGSADRRLRSRR